MQWRMQEAPTVSDEELIQRFITPNPYRPGVADARVSEHCVPLWAVVGHWKAVEHEAGKVAHDYGLPREAVDAALAYYRRHKHAVDARLAANAA